MRHVVRTRIFVTDISLWEDIARAHAEGFGDAPRKERQEMSKWLSERQVFPKF